VLWRRVVDPPKTAWKLALRRYLLPGHVDAGPMRLNGLVATVFHVKHRQTLRFELPREWFWVQPKGYLNGSPMARVQSRRNPLEAAPALEAKAVAGENLIVFDVSGHYHEWTFTISMDEVELRPERGLLVVGPLEPDDVGSLALSTWDVLVAHPAAKPLQPDSDPAASLTSAFAESAHARSGRELEPGSPLEIALGSGGETIQAVVDLGRMTVGYWAFAARGAGRLILNGFESIQEGIPDFAWEMNNTYVVDLSDEWRDVVSLQRRGARYLLLQSADAEVRDLRVIESTLPTPSHRLSLPDPRLQAIDDACLLTLRLCSEDTFVDCPTYEQTFWVGDARNEALIAQMTTGNYEFLRRCWELAGESLSQGPMVNSHAPSGWRTIIPMWSFLWAIACKEHFEATGDLRFLERIYPRLQAQLESCERQIHADGLFWMDAWNLCDWAPMDQPGSGATMPNQAFLVWAARATAECATILGRTSDAADAAQIADTVAAAANKHLWWPGRAAFSDVLTEDGLSETFSLQSQTAAFLAGVSSSEREVRLGRLITGADDTREFVQPGTPFFLFFTLEALERMGEFRRIREIIAEKWGMMIDRGATTCWELFPGYMPGGRWTRSHCHAWSAAPAYFLRRQSLGIVRVGTEWSKILFRPVPLGLEFAAGGVPTPRGTIEADWTYGRAGFEFDVHAPDGVEVEVDLSHT
jgi:hypothetical protein